MAMVKPTALSVNAFDATSVHTFYFTSSGGNQVVKNKITVRENVSNTIVYENTATSFVLSHTVPSHTLTNGSYYNYTITTYDVDDNASPESNIVSFHCYTTPTLTFTNIPISKIVNNGTYTFDVQYAQAEGELLDYAYVTLYTSTEAVFQKGNNLGNTSAPPFILQQLFSGMENNTSYYIEAFGVTVNGTEFNTGKIDFSVIIHNPEIFSQLTLEDKCKDGYTQVTSNVLLADGKSNPSPPEYVESNTKVYLPIKNDWNLLSDVNTIPSDFILKIYWEPVNIGDFCMILNQSGFGLKLSLNRDIQYRTSVGGDYVKMTGTDGTNNLTVYSNYVPIMNNTSKLLVWIKKVGQTWELILDTLQQTKNIMCWNCEHNNAVYNKLTDKQYVGESYASGTQHVNSISNLNIFPLTNVFSIGNGKNLGLNSKLGNIYVTTNTDLTLYKYNSYDYVCWDSGYSITNDFIIRLWMSPYMIDKVFTMNNGDKNNRYDIEFVREIPYGQSVGKDYFTLTGYVGGVKTVFQYSNAVNITNNTSQLFLWIKKVGNAYTLILETLSQTNNVMTWNSTNNNVVWNRVTNLQYVGENYKQGVQLTTMAGDMESIFPIIYTQVNNGVFDQLDITRNTDIAYTTTIPTWDFYTELNCNFNGNIDGGNINVILTQLSSIKVKRRSLGASSWITLADIPIMSYDDLKNLTYQDSFCASGLTYQWALVPILTGGIEGNYVTATLTPKRDGIFLSDGNTIFKFYNGTIFGQTTQNERLGVLQPISKQYPIIIQNSDVYYKSGTMQANLYGYTLDTTNIINRNDVVLQTNDFLKFMRGNSAKMLYDWNGNIYLVRKAASPTIDYNSSYGGGVTLVGYTWVEQGAYDSQSDLYNNGLINTAS